MGKRLALWVAGAMLWPMLAAAPALAQYKDPYTAPYCEPPENTKLLYTNRAYLILPKTPGSPPLYFSYRILGTQTFVQRRGQLLFDDGSDRWEFASNPEGLQLLWPLKPQNRFELDRVERTTGERARVSFLVLGLEPITVGDRIYRSWKIRRLDKFDNGKSFLQFLWYAPDLCTLSAFTDSQHRLIKLLRVLEPGDRDYNRPLTVRKHHLYFADKDELVK